MQDLFTKQLIFEIEFWKRILDAMENEIVFMKGRMSQILKEYPDNSLLNAIEQYLNSLLVQDKLIQIFRNDLEKQSVQLKKMDKDTKQLKDKLKQHKKFRKEIETTRLQFEKMSAEFYAFFCEKFFDKANSTEGFTSSIIH